MKVKFFPASFLFFMALSPMLYADYSQELRDQIAKIEKDAATAMTLDYFHDMGIVAHKADDAQLTDLSAEITRGKLILKMSDYVAGEIEEIKKLYEADPVSASRKLRDLNRFDKFYEPTGAFLQTAGGQAISAELIQIRKFALAGLNTGCSEKASVSGLKALRMTGLFITRSAEEITSLRELEQSLDCCLAFSPKIHYAAKRDFKTDYEQGVLSEEGELTLESGREDYNNARWSGTWTYSFDGREGKGQGVSPVTLAYTKGQPEAVLTIGSAKMSSSGRFNFPISMAGDRKTLEIQGSPLEPFAVLAGTSIYMIGCKEKKEA